MRYIDVTLTLEHGMRGVNFEPAKTKEKDGWNASMMHLYSHAGTHMDAPVHFEVNEYTIDRISPERFFSKCYVIDLHGIKPDAEITVENLGEVKNLLQNGEGLIFRTGWSEFLNDPVYRNSLPGITRELAQWCVDKGVSVVGVEPPSVADLKSMKLLTEIHEILLGGDVIIVEGLTNLGQVSKQKVDFVALPLKIKNGDGSPCRAIIIED